MKEYDNDQWIRTIHIFNEESIDKFILFKIFYSENMVKCFFAKNCQKTIKYNNIFHDGGNILQLHTYNTYLYCIIVINSWIMSIHHFGFCLLVGWHGNSLYIGLYLRILLFIFFLSVCAAVHMFLLCVCTTGFAPYK